MAPAGDAGQFAWRIRGVAVLCASGGVDLLNDWLASSGRPAPQPLATLLCLTGFLLAMFGTLLIINGSRLHDHWHQLLDRRVAGNEPDAGDAAPAAVAPDRPLTGAASRAETTR